MPLQIIRADITTLSVDAIVCPTNRHLLPGSGIDRVVYEKAGEGFAEECSEKAWCPEGGAVILNGYDLPSKYVIMTVGPHWNGGDWGELDVLEKAYRSSLECVRELSVTSVAVPLISAGYYGVPDYLSLRTATDTIREFLDTYDADVYIVVYNRLAFDLSKGIFHDVAQYIGEEEVSRWEKGLGRNKCIPRYKESRPVDADNGIPSTRNGKFPNDMLLFQHMGKDPLEEKDLASEKKGIIGGARTSVDIELEDAADSCFEEKGAAESESEAVSDEDRDAVRNAVKFQTSPLSRQELDRIARRESDGFSPYLRRCVNEKFEKASDCYNKANIDRKLYSKIMKDDNYNPTKDTALAFAMALELDEDDFTDMLSRAGYALSKYDRRDNIIRYFVEHRNYDILLLNEVLLAFDLNPIGYRKQ